MSSCDLTLVNFSASTLLSSSSPAARCAAVLDAEADAGLCPTPATTSCTSIANLDLVHPRPAVPRRLWRRSLNLAAPALLSPRSSAALRAAELDVDAEASHPASHVFVVFEPVVSSCDLTLVKLAALTLLRLAAPQRLAPKCSTPKPKLDPVQLLRLRFALRPSISIWCIRGSPCRKGLATLVKSCRTGSSKPWQLFRAFAPCLLP